MAAVASGVALWVAVSIATSDFWGPAPSGRSDTWVLLLRVLGGVGAGYLTGLVAKRAHLGHALCLGLILAGWSLVVRLIELDMGPAVPDWPRWTVGACTFVVWNVAGGLLRYWQVTIDLVRSTDCAELGAAPNVGPAASSERSEAGEGPASVS